MAYTKHSWREKAGSTGGGGDRETWLNNLETQYDEVVSYCTTTTHDASYYTEAEMVALPFYNPGQDGTGSGFVCETLDGYTAVQILASQVSAGTIVLWGGSEASIPAGWVLCNGGSSTPDLRTKIPVAAGGTYSRGDTGGAATVSSTASAITIAGHALTSAEMPSHTHGGIVDYVDTQVSLKTAYNDYNGYPWAQNNTTASTGGGSAHGHTGSTIAAGQGTTGNNWPAYKAYCYIMKT